MSCIEGWMDVSMESLGWKREPPSMDRDLGRSDKRSMNKESPQGEDY